MRLTGALRLATFAALSAGLTIAAPAPLLAQ